MNKARRVKLSCALDSISQAHTFIESVSSDEEDSLNNLPENLEGSDRYAKMEKAVDLLEEAMEHLEEAKSCIEEASE